MKNCISAVDLATKLWKACDGLVPAQVIAIEQTSEATIEYFNSVVGNSPLHVGARALPFNAPQTGKIDVIGDRTYVGTRPTRSQAKLTITKTSGKDHVTIHVCGVDSNGAHSELATFEASDATPDGHTFQVEIPPHRIVLVVLDGKRVIGTMGYTLRLIEN